MAMRKHHPPGHLLDGLGVFSNLVASAVYGLQTIPAKASPEQQEFNAPQGTIHVRTLKSNIGNNTKN